MEIKNKKSIIIISLFFAIGVLSVCDFYIISIKNQKQYSLSNDIAKNKTEVIHKDFDYSDILNTIEGCSPKFILIKIEKNDINKNFINTEVKYKGEMEGLIKGLEIMKMQEIVKGINEINIVKSKDNGYTAEINVDFLKFK